MMKKTQKKKYIPDLTEFTDDEGKRWVQTSTEDLFSIQELNDILESLDREKDHGEVVIARIDFQKVNREYYEAAVKLQERLQKQNELLKKVLQESKEKIEKKNRKLKELIDYIKKLHLLLAYMNKSQEGLDSITIPEGISLAVATPREKVIESVYEEVEEVLITAEAREIDFTQ